MSLLRIQQDPSSVTFDDVEFSTGLTKFLKVVNKIEEEHECDAMSMNEALGVLEQLAKTNKYFRLMYATNMAVKQLVLKLLRLTLQQSNFKAYDAWIRIFVNVARLDTNPFDFTFLENESICCFYNEFFISSKEAFFEIYLSDKKYETDEYFLYALICMLKTLPLMNLIEHQFLHVVVNYVFKNHEKSLIYERVMEALSKCFENVIEFTGFEREPLLILLNFICDKFIETRENKYLRLKLLLMFEGLAVTIQQSQSDYVVLLDDRSMRIFKICSEIIQNETEPHLEFCIHFFDSVIYNNEIISKSNLVEISRCLFQNATKMLDLCYRNKIPNLNSCFNPTQLIKRSFEIVCMMTKLIGEKIEASSYEVVLPVWLKYLEEAEFYASRLMVAFYEKSKPILMQNLVPITIALTKALESKNARNESMLLELMAAINDIIYIYNVDSYMTDHRMQFTVLMDSVLMHWNACQFTHDRFTVYLKFYYRLIDPRNKSLQKEALIWKDHISHLLLKVDMLTENSFEFEPNLTDYLTAQKLIHNLELMLNAEKAYAQYANSLEHAKCYLKKKLKQFKND